MKTETPWDVVIVGGATAGLSAALILSRARRRVLVLDAGNPRNRFAPHMHGVLSRDGYSPLDLVADGRREVRAADGVIETATVTGATRLAGGGFELTTDAGHSIRTRRIIVATGIRDELPNIAGLTEHWGRGVVACPYCDGFESRGKRIGVLLGSPLVHKAHLIRAYSETVTVLTALAGTLDEGDLRALAARGIRVDDRPISHVTSDGDTLTGIAFTDGSTLTLDTIFVDPDMVPLDDLLRQLEVDLVDTPMGVWTSVDATFQSSEPGVYAVGSVANPGALVPVAAAAGVTAATAINTELVMQDVAEAVAGLSA